MAEWTRDTIASFGIEAAVESVPTLLSYPISRSVTLLDGASGETLFEASLSEDVIPEDATSDDVLRNQTYLGYAPSGEAQGRLVYANYARPTDFDALEAAGVSVEGAVVITRYGECFRGLKARNAEQRGAIAVIIYSDPADDGFGQGDVYPEGPWRPASSVQRGSTWFLSSCAGDPSRAYLPEQSIEDVCGYSTEELVPQIPVLPMSYEDAEPLLRSLGGPAVPEGWQGGLLGFEYRYGPSAGDTAVRVVTNNERVTAPIWNTIAVIPGTLADTDPALDRPVVIGNHRDAWVFGAVDPNSGSSAMIEVARGFGELLKTGWRPKRTIYLCSWSGEEFGLIGSTAWGEINGHGFLKNATVYLNVDSAVSGGDFRVSATASMGSALLGVLEVVPDPAAPEGTAPGSVVADRWDGQLGTLGSGSDYTVFLDHLGVACVDMGFKGSGGSYGVYHSTYDSFDWVATQADPTFEIHAAAAQIWGLLTLRFADAEVLPFDHSMQASALYSYVHTVSEIGNSAELDLSDLHTAADEFAAAAEAVGLEQRRAAAAASSGGGGGGGGEELNDRLAFTERRFLAPDGLPLRPWFKHVLQCPGLDTGYQADVFPGVVQSLRDGEVELAQAEVGKAAVATRAAAAFLLRGSDE